MATAALRRGDSGSPVADLQHRLAGAGWGQASFEPGEYGSATETAVRGFQAARGLRTDGICGAQTWAALVEAGYRLGDRLLYSHLPVLRGDDVAELQRRLSALGFDVGRVDGIFGPDTASAVSEFQRAAGLSPDRIGGPATVAALARLGRRDGTGADPSPVAEVRERERLRQAPRLLAGRQVALGHPGGLDALLVAAGRAVSARGASAVPLPQFDGGDQAEAANLLKVDVFVGFCLDPDLSGCEIAFWRSAHGHLSAGGRRLADLLAPRLAEAVSDGGVGMPAGMALPVLRETRMPAVVCSFGSALVPRTAAVAAALAEGLEAWCAAPYED